MVWCYHQRRLRSNWLLFGVLLLFAVFIILYVHKCDKVCVHTPDVQPEEDWWVLWIESRIIVKKFMTASRFFTCSCWFKYLNQRVSWLPEWYHLEAEEYCLNSPIIARVEVCSQISSCNRLYLFGVIENNWWEEYFSTTHQKFSCSRFNIKNVVTECWNKTSDWMF